jgi:hypothetical protein
MKCDIIRDFLPSYIEGLTSESSNEEIRNHLMDCEECRAFHQEMTGDIQEDLPITEIKELDYLKKVRKNYIRKVAIAAGTVAVILLILVSLFAVGFPVSSEDMEMTYGIQDNHIEINFQLKNGHDLIQRTEPEIIFDDNHKVIGLEQHCKFAWVFHNPFDDVGSSFSLGMEVPDPDTIDNSTITVVIEFADKTVKFVNGKLVE